MLAAAPSGAAAGRLLLSSLPFGAGSGADMGTGEKDQRPQQHEHQPDEE